MVSFTDLLLFLATSVFLGFASCSYTKERARARMSTARCSIVRLLTGGWLCALRTLLEVVFRGAGDRPRDDSAAINLSHRLPVQR